MKIRKNSTFTRRPNSSNFFPKELVFLNKNSLKWRKSGLGQLFSSDKSFKATHGILKCTKALSSKPKLIIRFWHCVYFETALYSEVVSFLFILHSKASLRVKVY